MPSRSRPVDNHQTVEAGNAEVEAFVLASRALLGVANRSLQHLEGALTAAQFRLLIVVSELGSAPSARVAEALGVAPSTVTRVADRLVAARYLQRATSPLSRSIVTLEMTANGRRLVEDVLQRRREEITLAFGHMSADERSSAARGMRAFARALGEGHGELMSGPRPAVHKPSLA